MNLRFETPLKWPEGMPATPRAGLRSDHGFTSPLSFSESSGYLSEELEQIGTSGILYLDLENPMIDRLRKKVGSRVGAALYFRYQGANYVVACDRWNTVEHNVYALHLALRQCRNMERWGLGQLGKMLKPFEAEIFLPLPLADPDLPAWMGELGLGPTATLEDAIAVYHRRAKQLAQNTEALTRLNILMEEARRHFNRVRG